MDIFLYGLLAIFSFVGARNGFIDEARKVLSIFGGIFIALTFSDLIRPVFSSINNDTLAYSISYTILFVGTSIALNIISRILKKFIELGNIGWIDNVLGAGLGICNGVIIISIIILFLRSNPFKDSANFNSILERSYVVEVCDNINTWITESDQVQKKVKEMKDSINQLNQQSNQ
tara:strand:- start:458 stop:982 length:525 start_codon:yes stop_codon:yes gene_type:complete